MLIDGVAIQIDDLSFSLNGKGASYRFHVDRDSGDLISKHFGGTVYEDPIAYAGGNGNWAPKAYMRREFPELGRGDFRVPAVHIRHAQGHTVTHFKYQSHTVVDGKPKLPGLPCTFGTDDEVKTVIIHMHDSYNSVSADLSYSIFPQYDAIVRSVKVTNKGDQDITVEKLASFSFDLPKAPNGKYDFIGLHGEWARERQRTRGRVNTGVQGYVKNPLLLKNHRLNIVIDSGVLKALRRMFTTHSLSFALMMLPKLTVMYGAWPWSTLAHTPQR